MHTSSSGSCTILRNALEMRHRHGIGPALASPLPFRSLLRVSIALSRVPAANARSMAVLVGTKATKALCQWIISRKIS